MRVRSPGRHRRAGRGKLRQCCEYQAARFGLAVMMRLGPEAACRLAGGVATFGYLILGKRRRVAVDNLLQSGVAASPRAARRLARASFRHLGHVVAESFFAPRLLASEAGGQAVDLDMPAATRKIIEEPGKGVILVSGHLGNWEFGAQALARYKPLTGIARAMDNPRVQQLVERSRMRGDFETIDKHMARPMDLVRALRHDRILALLTDQHASAGGIVVSFFGRPAATYTTPAVLHRLTHAPVVFGSAVRLGTLRYRFVVSEPLDYPCTDDREADIRAITQDLASRLEAAIRRHPEQYLWAHRRWKVGAAEAQPAGDADSSGNGSPNANSNGSA
jgi:KDO2-lipid IV(A) lauroyltransferase